MVFNIMKGFLHFLVLCTFWFSCVVTECPTTLRLLHVLFRHGDRNPDQSSLIPNSTYYDESYYPEGYGQLTDAGKRTEYRLGQRLRTRYNNFFTDNWNINFLDATTTNVNRTKMSLDLVLAGLYPPQSTQTWSGTLPWQPIPYNYKETSLDKEMQPWTACRTRYRALLNEILNTTEIVEYGERYAELLDILREKTGSSSITLTSPFSYYFGFLTQQEVGYPLDEWAEAIYPQPIHAAAVDFYYYFTNTTEIKRIVGGFFIRKILEDSQAKMNGTLTPTTRKAFLYSAHEMNVASILLVLGGYLVDDVPPYGSHILFEVHEIDEVWGFKVYYQNYEGYDPIEITIPGCDHFCPFEDFYSLMEDIIPEDSDCTDDDE